MREKKHQILQHVVVYVEYVVYVGHPHVELQLRDLLSSETTAPGCKVSAKEPGKEANQVTPTPAYRDTFPDLEDLAAYKELLSQAIKTTVLPFPHPTEEAFMAAGRVVVD